MSRFGVLLWRYLFESGDAKRLAKQVQDLSDLRITRDLPYIDDGEQGHLFDIYELPELPERGQIIRTGSASHKDAALQGVLHVILVAHADGGHQAVFTLHNLAAGVHQQEAAGAVGVLHLAGLKAALAEQGALMVPCRTGNGDKSA